MRAVAATLGLVWCPWFYRDKVFSVMILAAGGFWVWLWTPLHPITPIQILSSAFLARAVFYPALEELIFRGYLQGQLRQQSWGQQDLGGFTLANGCTSLLFMAGHLWDHPPLWAVAI